LALLFSAVSGTFLIKEGRANPFPMAEIEITLKNPLNITYNDNTIPVFFTATQVHLRSEISFSYSLDNQDHKPILNVTTVSEEMVPYNPPFYRKTMSGNFLLLNLSEGWHKIGVYCQNYEQSKSYSDYDAVDFFVDTIPIISFLSFEKMTFESSDVSFNFTVNQPTSQITYSLDGLEHIPISENITLTGLANGNHNITVYGTDEVGNTGVSETLDFTVTKPEPLESFPIATVSVASVGIVGAGLLVYFRRRKGKP
jgi:hypothetical protein